MNIYALCVVLGPLALGCGKSLYIPTNNVIQSGSFIIGDKKSVHIKQNQRIQT